MIKIIEKEDYVPYKLAKLLKEKGFDWECIGYYVDDEPNNIYYSFCGEINSTWEPRCCSAPTLQMAMAWLREVHKIDIDIVSRLSLNADDDHCYSYYIKHQYDKYAYKTYTDGEYQYFEDAVEAALKYCLENLI